MHLANQLIHQIDDPTLNRAERASLRCALAKELEEAGNYEAARGAMGDLWQRVGSRPQLDGLDQYTAAAVLLRAGALSGWIGSSKQIEGAQETAKNLITESITLFDALQETEKAAEALTDLAYCYWREGASDEARITLRDALSRLEHNNGERKVVALLRSAIVEITATRLNDALIILNGSASLVATCSNHTLKGNFHNTLANTLENLGTSERREDYTDRALLEYSAASFYFEQANHTRYLAAVENNLGFLLFRLNRFTEAHEHLDRARRLFVRLKDSIHTAQVDETRARTFLAQGRLTEAVKIARSAVHALEKGGEQAYFAEALTTYGISLARLDQHSKARLTLEHAIEVAHLAGNNEGAGLAALAIIEELGEHSSLDELRAIYARADQLLVNSQHPETLTRLRTCARRVLAAEKTRSEEFSSPNFVYAAEKTEALLHDAHRFANADGAVLITGETGTGKEVLAHLIHDWSGRAGELVAINCAALPDNLIESELFGHKKGSFTDAVADYAGAVRQAAGGTLFLDEIGELSLSNQAKLLRLIQNGEVHSIGAPAPERVNVRIIAATNRNLKEQVKNGCFRADLFYRLNTFHMDIPPLRERPEDVEVLAAHFIEEFSARHRRHVTFTPEAIAAMRQLPLKGNARELRSLIERTLLMARDGATIMAEGIETVSLRQTQHAGFADPWANFSLKEEVRMFEERLIELALKEAKGKLTCAARLLGFKHHESLNYRLQNRNKTLQSARKPAAARKRSIIRT